MQLVQEGKLTPFAMACFLGQVDTVREKLTGAANEEDKRCLLEFRESIIRQPPLISAIVGAKFGVAMKTASGESRGEGGSACVPGMCCHSHNT